MTPELSKILRARNRFFRMFKKDVQKVFVKQFSPVLNSKSIDAETLINIANESINEADYWKLFYKYYPTIGTFFAQMTTKNLAKKSNRFAMLKKAESIWTLKFTEFVKNNLGDRIVSITETTREQAIKIIRKSVEEATALNVGTAETSRLIQKNLSKEWGEMSLYRATRIATTETVSASNLGSFESAKASAIKLKKKWLTSFVRSRENHRELNGTTIDLDEKFQAIGEMLAFPGDPSATNGANVINCHCALGYVPADEDEMEDENEFYDEFFDELEN